MTAHRTAVITSSVVAALNDHLSRLFHLMTGGSFIG
jgi:hypothetical protein